MGARPRRSGSAKVVCPLPPYVVPRSENNAWFWLIGRNFPPKGWAFCNGQFLPINQNQALFSLLGTTYGGNGQTTFALPDLRGRAPIHMGRSHTLGEVGGAEAVTIATSQMPTHVHTLMGSSNTSVNTPSSASVLGKSSPQAVYGTAANLVAQDPGSISNAGGSQPHNNMQPYLVLNFIIALQGIFPSRN
jgi:microcystin-dependent protein